MRSLLLILFLLIAARGYAQEPELYHRVKVNTGKSGLSLLAKAGIAVDHGTYKKGVYLITDLSVSEIEKVKETGLSYTILIRDMSTYYKERNEKKSAEKPTGAGSCTKCDEYPTPLNFQLGSMGGFFTYAELLNILDSMKSKYPGLITAKQVISPSTTLQGRPLYYVKISDNAETNESTEPQVLYTALHHAREPESLSQLIFYMWYLLENYNTDAHIKYLVDHTEMYFVPCVNPDGYVYNQTTNPSGGGLWRKNRRNNGSSFGVDLNRNYGRFWGYDNEGSSPSGNSEVYRGPSGFSEPETQMIRDFCNTHQFQIALNAHTFSNLLIYPYGYVPSFQTPDSVVFQRFAADMAECSGFLTGTGDMTVGYVTNGDSDDWMYDEQTTKGKILAMTPEAGDQNDGFWPQMQRIIPIAKQTMDQNLDAAKLLTAFATVKATDEPAILQMNDRVHFNFQRSGLSNGTFTVSLIPLSANIASTGSPRTFTNPDHMLLLGDSIAISLNSTVSTDNSVRYVLKWENNTGYSVTDTQTRYYGATQLAFYSNGNTLDSFVATSWNTTTTQFVSATGSITDSPEGDYNANSSSNITTKGEIDLTSAAAAYLTFYARWDIESGFDYAELSVSDNNSTFTPLCGRYNHKGNENQNSSIAVYDGTQTSWVREYIDLRDYLGKKIRLRFTLNSDQGLEKDGFYFDEFAVHKVAGSPTVGILETFPEGIALGNIPNPCAGSTDIFYTLPKDKGNYELLVTDPLGRVVVKKEVNASRDHIRLDVGAFQNGVYFYRITAAGKMASSVKKMVIQN